MKIKNYYLWILMDLIILIWKLIIIIQIKVMVRIIAKLTLLIIIIT